MLKLRLGPVRHRLRGKRRTVAQGALGPRRIACRLAPGLNGIDESIAVDRWVRISGIRKADIVKVEAGRCACGRRRDDCGVEGVGTSTARSLGKGTIKAELRPRRRDRVAGRSAKDLGAGRS